MNKAKNQSSNRRKDSNSRTLTTRPELQVANRNNGLQSQIMTYNFQLNAIAVNYDLRASKSRLKIKNTDVRSSVPN